MVPDSGPLLFVSSLHPQIRLVFNQLRKTQEKILRHTSHHDFLVITRSIQLIPKGLLVKQHINTTSKLCSNMVNDALLSTSSRLLDILIIDSLNSVQQYSLQFVSLCRVLSSLANPAAFSFILTKLREIGSKLELQLLSEKCHKLRNNIEHASHGGHHYISADVRTNMQASNLHVNTNSIPQNFRSTPRPTPAPTRTHKRRWVKRARRHRAKLAPITNNRSVVNLSSHNLDEHETSILSRGLKFCPTPTSVDDLELRTDLDKFARRLRLKVHFHKDDEDDSDSAAPVDGLLNHPLLKRVSTFTPNAGKDPFLDAYITAVKTDVVQGVKPKTYRNISRDENKAMHDIKNNRSIVIKEADKGSAVVIQDRNNYVQECMRQLDNTDHYQKLDYDPTSEFSDNVCKGLDKALTVGLIDDELSIALRPKQPKPGRFYALPKIHKQFDTIPAGRPIVSANGSVTEKVSLFIDHHLKPHVSSLPSYVQDDMDFLRKIEAIKEDGPLAPNILLCTMDVSALYTNIPTEEGIAACRSFLEHAFSHEQLDAFCELMRLVLTHNNFTFNGTHYKQIFGTSMGTKLAPSMACLFMGRLEERLLSSVSKKPLMWIRYIDDVFFLWPHGPDELQRFVTLCNSFHPTIKFTSESSSKEIPFLDVLVSIKDGTLHTDLYSKPTDSHQFLHWTSCHPKHTKSSLPYSLAFRLNRICSSPETLHMRSDELAGFLKDRGYPSSVINRQIRKALETPRTEALRPRMTDVDKPERIPLVITYHPSLPKLSQILLKHLPILHSSDRCKNAIPNLPMVAYRRSSNIKDMVVRSTLPPEQPPPRGSFACGTCRSCNHDRPGIHSKQGSSVAHTQQGTSFTSSITGENHVIHKHLSCQTKNAIYLITCRKCQVQYVGETGRSLETRLIEHCADARHNRDTPVGKHFNMPGHSARHISVMCIDRPPKTDIFMRKKLEKDWISKLQTCQPLGLNVNV